jgi:hypothetical protein
MLNQTKRLILIVSVFLCSALFGALMFIVGWTDSGSMFARKTIVPTPTFAEIRHAQKTQRQVFWF